MMTVEPSSYEPKQPASQQQQQHQQQLSSLPPLSIQQQQHQRYVPVLGAQDPSPLRSAADTLVCRSSEFFEVLSPDAGPAVGQVGLRCGFCVETVHSIRSYVFPSNVRSIAVSLRQPMMAHLKECGRYPDEYKQVLLQSSSSAAGGGRGGDGGTDLRALGDFCLSRCHVAGIVDRHGGGLVFSGAPRLAAAPLPSPPYHYQPLPPNQSPEPRDEVAVSISQRGGNGGGDRPHQHQQFGVMGSGGGGGGSYHQQHAVHTDMPSDFPFMFVEDRWICKYCSRIPPPYRDAQNFWPQLSPPDARFIDYHLSICREFQKSAYFPQQHEVRSALPPPSSRYAPQPPWPEQPQAPHPLPYARGGVSMTSPYQQHHPYQGPAGAVPDQPLQPGDAEAEQAIEYLEANDLSSFDDAGNPVPPEHRLVLEDDRLMLTEYFFYLMKQLREVKFSEADRRTRGGKREKVKVGYGGLQCVHCVDIPQSRKFFWSNVDRLANSFAEIPAHIFRCKRCPQPTKDALLLLKKRHPEQMSRLPRGSQKIFFRRMWRRLHEEDPIDPAETEQIAMDAVAAAAVPSIDPQAPMLTVKTDSAASHATGNVSEESVYFLQRPSGEAAKTLVDGSMQPGPPSPKSRVLLAIPEDREWLSDMDCFTRRQLEVFCATAEDIAEASGDRKHPIQEGQVGIRCLHCAMASTPARGQSVAYPFSISGIYETAREFERLHLDNCEHLPLSAKSKMESLKKGASSLSSVVRKYFVIAAKALGLEDTDNGIRAGAPPIEIGPQAKFAFSDISSSPEEAAGDKKRKASSPANSPIKSSKRAALDQPPPDTPQQQQQSSQPDTPELKEAAI
jgi:hypothetical protein